MQKKVLITGWLGLVTAPCLFRKLTVKKLGLWTGRISTLNYTGSDEIGYYFFPGILYPPERIITDFIQPLKHDLYLVHYGRRDYSPALAAEAVARHAKTLGFKKIRIISVSMGDQLLSSLGHYLRNYVKEQRLEIVSIDSLPNSWFIKDSYLTALKAMNPILMTLRILGGWVAEIRCFRRDECWRSPAEVIEQLNALTSNRYDYTDKLIFRCIKAVIKDRDVFYDPEDAKMLYSGVFENYENETLVYFTPGELANIRDEKTVDGYRKVFKDLKWEF